MPSPRTVLAIDIGGSHVKILSSAGGDERRFASGPGLTPDAMASQLEPLWKDMAFDVISMGYPGPVIHNRIISEPHNLGTGWVGYDFAKRFGKPLKIVNDALMQAIGSYEGGRMLFLGLGTGLGAAMIVDKVAQPMEIGHLPYRKGHTFEHYLGNAWRAKHGNKRWTERVFDAVELLDKALEPDYVVLGGGNVEKLHQLPPKARRGNNADAFKGGFAVWNDPELDV